MEVNKVYVIAYQLPHCLTQTQIKKKFCIQQWAAVKLWYTYMIKYFATVKNDTVEEF